MTITFSKPAKSAVFFGSPICRVKIKPSVSSKTSSGEVYIAEFYSKTQVFHEKMSENEVCEFFKKHAGTTFKNAVKRCETEEITILSNKKGKITELRKKLENPKELKAAASVKGNGKNYILKEGIPVPFLVQLGIMTGEGKVIASKYDKFRQINRFLEFIDDISGELENSAAKGDGIIRVVDFGCGKSYLTFAVYYFLHDLKGFDCEITGLDLKKDVIEYCQNLAKKTGAEKLFFKTGDIKDELNENSLKNHPNLVITLHACDVATDFALRYCVDNCADVILSVPCCQHELNSKITKSRGSLSGGNRQTSLEPLLKYGILRERFAALATDAIRCEYLEKCGYKTQILEFIDMENTPKNLLIRAVKRQETESCVKLEEKAVREVNALFELLGQKTWLFEN